MKLIHLKGRAYAYWRNFAEFVGFCPRCLNWMNFTQHGRGICPRGYRW